MLSYSEFIYVTLKGRVNHYTVIDPVLSDEHLQGFCVERERLRTFRRDRIMYEIQEDDSEDMIYGLIQDYKKHDLAVSSYRSPDQLEVCFTGFKAVVKKELVDTAKEAKMHVAKSVTVNLDFLCVYGDLTPANAKLNKKLQKARNQGALLLNEEEFINLIKTGEIPDG